MILPLHGGALTVTVTVILFKCPKNKRPRGLPLDIRLLRLHVELPYMQNVLAHGTSPRSGVVAGSLIRFLNISGRPTLRRQPRNRGRGLPAPTQDSRIPTSIVLSLVGEGDIPVPQANGL
jgi:hypothetical protein